MLVQAGQRKAGKKSVRGGAMMGAGWDLVPPRPVQAGENNEVTWEDREPRRGRAPRRSGGRSVGFGSSLHSPHAAVGLAVPGVDADGTLAVLYSPHVVPQLAVGRGSGERKLSVGTPRPSTGGLSRSWSGAGSGYYSPPHRDHRGSKPTQALQVCRAQAKPS